MPPAHHANCAFTDHQTVNLDVAAGLRHEWFDVEPDDLDVGHLVELGNALLAVGKVPDAIASYESVLQHEPAHAGALTALARVYIERGMPAAVLPLCWQLVEAAPGDPNAHYLLGRAKAVLGDAGGAILALRDCLKIDPHNAGALHWLGITLAKIGMTKLAVPFLENAVITRPDDASCHAELGNVLQGLGETARAFACFRKAAALHPLITWPARRHPAEFSVLLVASPGIANIQPEFLFANTGYDSHFFALLPDDEPDEELLRRHGDIVVNLISDADQGHQSLLAASGLLDRLGKRTVNHPRRVLRTDRETVAALLADIPECHVPKTVRIPRAALAAPDVETTLKRRGFAFPLLLRMAGAHGGETFEKIDGPEDITNFLDARDAGSFYVTRYVDYRSADGFFRKYRFVLTDRDIVPYHLAIGEGWKVHHYTTSMHQHAWMQEEEKLFLENPGSVFSPEHFAAMAAIRDAVGLEFFGIDCAHDRAGRLLVFEVNASILVHNDNADFPYKIPFCLQIKRALGAMLTRIARSA
jgi:tetratricopeptide (TPR) repeat protein